MNKTYLFGTAVILTLTLGGCGEAVAPEVESPVVESRNVVGKVQTQPGFRIIGDDRGPCTGSLVSQKFNGQQITLKDSAGEIVGASSLGGWDGDTGLGDQKSLPPDKYGYNDGDLCSWDFSFSGVVVESDFYTLEFSDSRVTPPTITRDELMRGPVIEIG